MEKIPTPRAFQGESRSHDPYAGGVMTKHGWFSYEDIHEAGGKFDYDRNGERIIRFPVSKTVMGQPIFREVPDHVVRQREDERA